MSTPRIAIFDDWWPFHIGTESNNAVEDKPSHWAETLSCPQFTSTSSTTGEREYVIRDANATNEIHRLTKFKTCPICRQPMESISSIENEVLLLCLRCGYWGGRGFREWNSHRQAVPLRGVISRYQPLKSIANESTEYLITHLRKSPHDMTKISPLRAERFVMDLLSDYLDCEVKPLGGTKDNGIDGYIVKNDTVNTIIQVKWHANTNKAEGVSVVREVAGTLLARRVPNGIIVSNRIRFSKPSAFESESVSGLTVSGIGQLNLSLLDYHDVIDMLEISNIKLTTNMKAEDWFKISDDICVFDGAARLSERQVRKYGE